MVRYTRTGYKGRKRFTGKKTVARTTVGYRKPFVRRFRSIVSKVYTYRQYCYTLNISQVAGSDYLSATNLAVSSLPNFTDFAYIYDQYRVNYLEFTFYPTTSLADQAEVLGPAVVSRGGLLYVAIDKDDSTAPGALSYLQEFQGVKTHNAGTTFKVIFKPGVVNMTWNGSSSSPASTHISPWIDASQNSIPHYGLKYGITAAPASALALIGWRVDLYCSISFKGVK